MSRLFNVALAGCTVLASACSGNTQGLRQSPLGRQTYSVEVTNQNSYTATVYAYRPGFRKRLGTVEPTRTRSYSFTWPHPEIRFQIRFLAAGCLIGENMPAVEGDQFLLLIEPFDHRRASQSFCG